MYMKAFILLTVCVATLMFFGCGGDEEDETVVEVISNKTPVISVEKIRENPDPEDEMYREVWFKFTADPAPRKEMLVSFEVFTVKHRDLGIIRRGTCSFGDDEEWANISKGKKESEELSISIDANGYCNVEILPIPTVSIVGEGKRWIWTNSKMNGGITRLMTRESLMIFNSPIMKLARLMRSSCTIPLKM